MSMMDGAMSAGQSYYYENRQFLLKTIMNQLGLTDSDLENSKHYLKGCFIGRKNKYDHRIYQQHN